MGAARYVLSFGYGSNLCLDRLEARLGGAGTAVPLGTGFLSGYRFRFNKVSRDERGDPLPSGKGNAVQTDGRSDRVWGVVFCIERTKLSALDDVEGLGHGYARVRRPVQVGGRQLRPFVYLATETKDALEPYDWYKRLVVDGARRWPGIPPEYIDDIDSRGSRPDPVKRRTLRERSWKCPPAPSTPEVLRAK